MISLEIISCGVNQVAGDGRVTRSIQQTPDSARSHVPIPSVYGVPRSIPLDDVALRRPECVVVSQLSRFR